MVPASPESSFGREHTGALMVAAKAASNARGGEDRTLHGGFHELNLVGVPAQWLGAGRGRVTAFGGEGSVHFAGEGFGCVRSGPRHGGDMAQNNPRFRSRATLQLKRH